LALPEAEVALLAAAARPVAHEAVLALAENFLVWKRQFGTEKEKSLYEDMSLISFVDRLLSKVIIKQLNN